MLVSDLICGDSQGQAPPRRRSRQTSLNSTSALIIRICNYSILNLLFTADDPDKIGSVAYPETRNPRIIYIQSAVSDILNSIERLVSASGSYSRKKFALLKYLKYYLFVRDL